MVDGRVGRRRTVDRSDDTIEPVPPVEERSTVSIPPVEPDSLEAIRDAIDRIQDRYHSGHVSDSGTAPQSH